MGGSLESSEKHPFPPPCVRAYSRHMFVPGEAVSFAPAPSLGLSDFLDVHVGLRVLIF